MLRLTQSVQIFSNHSFYSIVKLQCSVWIHQFYQFIWICCFIWFFWGKSRFYFPNSLVLWLPLFELRSTSPRHVKRRCENDSKQRKASARLGKKTEQQQVRVPWKAFVFTKPNPLFLSFAFYCFILYKLEYTLSGYLIRYNLLVLGWTPFCLLELPYSLVA